ncbi:glycosyltransferase [Alkalinema pantanalense CENA528]|uniref:glycosyltransferase n=1 Tax=Alkalinema pantanalense TaxID=1620705 RepID=UPI003D6F5BEF
MKILHVIPSVSPVRGGPSQAVLEMVYALRQQGVDATIVTTNDSGDDLLPIPLHQWIDYPVHQSSPADSSDAAHKTVPLQAFPKFAPAISAVREFTFSPALTRWLWHSITDYDLVHIHAIFSYPSTIAMAIARARNVPYIVRPLGQLCTWSLQQGAAKKRAYLKIIEMANLQGARSLHFTALQEQQEAEAVGLATPSFVVPHGLDMPAVNAQAQQELRQQLNLPADQPIVLFLSRLHPKKGFDALIPALQQLRDLPFQFVIAGSGAAEYEAQLAAEIETAGLTDRTHWFGFAKGETKQRLLQGADLFVLPSHSENFGIAVLEALANGLPVLITPGVALATLVQDHALGWVTEQTPDAVAAGLRSALQDPQTREAMGIRAELAVRSQFSWPQIAKQLVQHYQSILFYDAKLYHAGYSDLQRGSQY